MAKPSRRSVRSTALAPVEMDIDDGYESPLTSEGSGSDWESSGRRMYRKKSALDKPSAKKAKLGASKSVKGRNRTALNLLPTLALDVLFEIFSHLEPADLLSRARSNKALHKTLMSRSSVTVWKAAARNMIVPPPACPPDMSEPAWANLLFGGSRCQICLAPNIHRISFTLRKRVCVFCLKTHLVHSNKFASTFPDYGAVIMNLIPYTRIGGWSNGAKTKGKFFWTSDVKSMAVQLGAYQSDVQMRKPGAKSSLEDFKKARMDFVAGITAYESVCEAWLRRFEDQRRTQTSDAAAQRLDAIKAKFIELGYSEDDLRCLQEERAATLPAPLTDRSWNLVRKKLEPEVQTQKRERLAQERKCVLKLREAVVSQKYREYVWMAYTAKPIKAVLSLPRNFDVFAMRPLPLIWIVSTSGLFACDANPIMNLEWWAVPHCRGEQL